MAGRCSPCKRGACAVLSRSDTSPPIFGGLCTNQAFAIASARRKSARRSLESRGWVRVMKSAGTYSSFGTYPSSRDVWLSCEEQLRDTDAAPRGRGRRGLTQNRFYTPYASAQKRTPSSNDEKTGNRWRPPLNTLASVSSRFFKIYVSFDHLS